MKKKSYAVFGLGRYGLAVSKELVANGMDVIAIDADSKIVNDAAAFLPVCKCADITDPEVISRLGIDSIDVVIICMADHLDATVMAIALCKEVGVKKIVVKCGSEIQQKIFLRVGADEVVFPEKESGMHLAKMLVSFGFVDMMSISEDVSIVEIDVSDEWAGKTLIDLSLRKKYGFNVIAIKNGANANVNFNPETPLNLGEKLIVVANKTKLMKMKQ